MADNTGISWAHNTQNFWVGCDKIAPECAHCYIHRILIKQGRKPWGEIYRTKTWEVPGRWNRRASNARNVERVFTCSLSDFFHVKADDWRADAWKIIKDTPHLVWLILTKRPELIEKRLPTDWPYPNVWLGVSVGCRMTLNKMDSLRRIPIHQKAVRWISSEPLLEDISHDINLDGFGWVVTGEKAVPVQNIAGILPMTGARSLLVQDAAQCTWTGHYGYGTGRKQPACPLCSNK